MTLNAYEVAQLALLTWRKTKSPEDFHRILCYTVMSLPALPLAFWAGLWGVTTAEAQAWLSAEQMPSHIVQKRVVNSIKEVWNDSHRSLR